MATYNCKTADFVAGAILAIGRYRVRLRSLRTIDRETGKERNLRSQHCRIDISEATDEKCTRPLRNIDVVVDAPPNTPHVIVNLLNFKVDCGGGRDPDKVRDLETLIINAIKLFYPSHIRITGDNNIFHVDSFDPGKQSSEYLAARFNLSIDKHQHVVIREWPKSE